MEDPYADETFRWWHLAWPSPELLAAAADGWLGPAGVAVDLGCGLGTEAGFLAASGWRTVGLDLSAAAVRAAGREHRDARFARADVLRLPLRDGSTDLLLDRGCFHYVAAADRDRYAEETRRVLRPGGRFLLRACRSAAGIANDIDRALITHVFRGWQLDELAVRDIPSDTRRMPALIVRLRTAC
jgi:SAM-dependent methyltransferase